MGTKQHIEDSKLWSIPLIDNEVGNIPIRDIKGAFRLLKEMIADI